MMVNEKEFLNEIEGKFKIAFERYERNLGLEVSEVNKIFFKAGFLSGYQYCLADEIKPE